jgi:hypothetical protein
MPSNASDNPFNVNVSTAGRFGAGGLLAGASLATLLGLAKVLADMRRKGESDESDSNQLVLTLPTRIKEAEQLIDHIGYEKIAESIPGFGPEMEKSANWQTMVASILAAGGAGTAGYALVDKLFEMRRIKELEAELERAQTEYLDKLQLASDEVKEAGMFGDREGEPSFRKLDYPLGIAALMTLLGAGGTAWLTKRFLDKLEEEKQPESFKPRKPIKVQKVIFKSASADGEKEASDNTVDPELMPAALGVFLDICSGEPTIVGSEKVAAEMKKIDMTPTQLYKQAGESFDRFLLTLKQNPELRKQMKDMAMDTHPLLKYFKWAAGLPYIRDLTDTSLYDQLSSQYGPRREDQPMAIKYGSVLDSLVGSLAAEKAVDIGKDMLSSKEQKPEEEELQDAVRQLDIGAADPEAAEFVNKNAEQLKDILTKLVQEGAI